MSVSLTWDAPSCGVTNLSDLVVARWDAGQTKWKDEGNGGTSGSMVSGTIISSAPVTLFSPFTLASRTSANPLPIELLNFNCNVVDNKKVQLTWVTATELNNNYFVIERSVDGVTFETINTQKGAGNSTTKLNYNYTDINKLQEAVYYRLKQVDYDGRTTYSQLCSAIGSYDGGILFYPNPTKNYVTIDYYFDQKPSYDIITVTDVAGRVIVIPITYTNNKISVDFSGLDEGIYFLKVTISNDEITHKISVVK